MVSNEVERRRWNNAEMVASWPRREAFTDQVTPYLLNVADPQPGERVLEIGSGGGKAALALAAAVRPAGKVVGADISQGMVELATSRAAEAKARNVRFAVTDVQVNKITGGPFDLAVSQFGVMFFDDPVAAFSNIRKHLKPGGRLVFACWQPMKRQKWALGPVLAPFVPPTPPPDRGKLPTGPFSLADPRATRAKLLAAGFSEVVRMPRQLVVRTERGALSNESQLRSSGVPPGRMEEARVAVDRYVQRFVERSGDVRFEINFQFFTAKNPG